MYMNCLKKTYNILQDKSDLKALAYCVRLILIINAHLKVYVFALM